MGKRIALLSFIIVFFSSCDLEKVVDIGTVPITPHLVLNGLLYSDRDTSYFYITRSRPIYSKDTIAGGDYNSMGYNIIEDVNINLSVNGKACHIEYSPVDSAYILLGKLKAGDKVSVQSLYEEQELQSMVILPSAPEVISVDTTSFDRIEGVTLKHYTMFKLKIRDMPDRNDYYRLLVNNKLYYIKGDTIQNYPYPGYYYSSWANNSLSNYYSNDPVLTDGYMGTNSNSNLGSASSLYNYFSVFRDVRFAGKEYTLSFYVDNSMSYWFQSEDSEYRIGRHLTVKLQSISEDLYKYYSSLQRSRQASSDKVSEPVIVHSNINGGLGILGACNEIKIFEYKNF